MTIDRPSNGRPRLRVALASFLTVAAASAALALVAGTGVAVQAQPGPLATESAANMHLVAFSDLGQPAQCTSDLWYLNDTVYVGDWCGPQNGGTGTSFVDVSDPTNPTVVYKSEVLSGTFSNDVKAITVDTAAFQGDLLVESLDGFCSGSQPAAEVRLWDVSDPAAPVRLGTLTTGDGIHNAYVLQRADNVYLLLAAPSGDFNDNTACGFEDADLDADFAIADLTDPSDPRIVSTWRISDAYEDLPGSTFLHDVWANRAGTIAYAAYWDAGMVLLDISDVENPMPISRWSYADVAEGNTHAIVPTADESHVIVADEDYDPTQAVFRVLTPDASAGPKEAIGGLHLSQMAAALPVEGELAWVGRGCSVDPAYPDIEEDDPYLSDPTGKIAVIRRGGCSFANKIWTAGQHDAIGAVIFNHNPGGGPPPMGGVPREGTTIPGIGINHADGDVISSTLEAGTTMTGRIAIEAGEYGYVRIVDVRDMQNPTQVAEYVLPETRMFPPPEDATWTGYGVHNPYVEGDAVYFGHYDAGVRVVDLADPTSPTEVGHVIPADQDRDGTVWSSTMWGAMPDEDGNIYASDLNLGLWVMRMGEPAVPTDPPPTAVPPTAEPTPMEHVCPQILGRVPRAAVDAALADPGRVAGYGQPADPAKPVGPYNPRRTWLSLQHIGRPYHPLFNGLVYKAGCP